MKTLAIKRNAKAKRILKRGAISALSLVALATIPHMQPKEQTIPYLEIVLVDEPIIEKPIPTLEKHPELRTYEQLIRENADKYGFDSDYIARIIWQESRGIQDAVSRAGAAGLMQLMPENIERYDVTNPNNPVENIRAGCEHLRWLTNKFGGNLEQGLAAYNAGQRHVVKALKPKSGEVERIPLYGGALTQYKYHDFELRTEILPNETRNYLDKIMTDNNETNN